MTVLNRTAASLRIFGDDLDPDEITAALGKQPDVAESRGDTIRMRSGRERIARTGRWSLKVDRRTPGDLDGQVAELLAGTTDDVTVWQRITARYKADIFCGLFLAEGNEGVGISPETMRMLGERGIMLGLDIYGACSDDNEKTTRFTWGDIVIVKAESPAEFRPGQRAWVVGVSREDERKGAYKAIFPEGVVYTIEFEDGSAIDIPEKLLMT